MSRVGKLPVKIPDKVKVSVANGDVKIEGPKGKIERPPAVKPALADLFGYAESRLSANDPLRTLQEGSRLPDQSRLST